MLWTILVGALVGWLAGQIVRGRGYGIFGNILIGLVGGLIGGFLFGLLGLGPTGLIGDLIAGTVGAVLLVLFLFGAGPRRFRRY
ncbi:MAG: GlsB/YeaQ/YmgE family stress response membrane protein [Alphaproteobacteria bacterium]|nr:MAG: GlsB/YeaQ/YmgE family stress response membrane protein [Alphaproteobacteria bacterium]